MPSSFPLYHMPLPVSSNTCEGQQFHLEIELVEET